MDVARLTRKERDKLERISETRAASAVFALLDEMQAQVEFDFPSLCVAHPGLASVTQDEALLIIKGLRQLGEDEFKAELDAGLVVKGGE